MQDPKSTVAVPRKPLPAGHVSRGGNPPPRPTKQELSKEEHFVLPQPPLWKNLLPVVTTKTAPGASSHARHTAGDFGQASAVRSSQSPHPPEQTPLDTHASPNWFRGLLTKSPSPCQGSDAPPADRTMVHVSSKGLHTPSGDTLFVRYGHLFAGYYGGEDLLPVIDGKTSEHIQVKVKDPSSSNGSYYKAWQLLFGDLQAERRLTDEEQEQFCPGSLKKDHQFYYYYVKIVHPVFDLCKVNLTHYFIAVDETFGLALGRADTKAPFA